MIWKSFIPFFNEFFLVFFFCHVFFIIEHNEAFGLAGTSILDSQIAGQPKGVALALYLSISRTDPFTEEFTEGFRVFPNRF
jgi:hypothetical protein